MIAKMDIFIAHRRISFGKMIKLRCLSLPQKSFDLIIEELYNDKDEPLEDARHALMKLKIKCNRPVKIGSIIRKQKQE